MFHFDWGVFWAVLAAAAIIYSLHSRIDPVWHEQVLKKNLELQERQIEMLQSQTELQQEIIDKLPTREHIDWSVP